MIDPEKIVFEGERFIIYDVVEELPKHPNYPRCSTVLKPDGKRAVVGQYKKVADRIIERVFFHQTAGSYSPGKKGVMNTAHFFVTDPEYTESGKWKGNGRGWPGFGYTWFVSHAPEQWEGKHVIYQCNHLDTVSWHTGDQNNLVGAAIAFQGYFRSRHLGNFEPFPGTDGEPSSVQMACAEGFWEEYAKDELGLTDERISGHFEAGKKTCPGDTLEKYVLAKRQEADKVDAFDPLDAPDDLIALDSWKMRQAALVALGHDLGPYGPKKNGVDGKPGNMTRLAIEAQEELFGLARDGIWDTRLEYLVKLRLRASAVAESALKELF